MLWTRATTAAAGQATPGTASLFPDPHAFIAALHERGLKTALNLHPAEGIHAHEAQYEAMCATIRFGPAVRRAYPL